MKLTGGTRAAETRSRFRLTKVNLRQQLELAAGLQRCQVVHSTYSALGPIFRYIIFPE